MSEILIKSERFIGQHDRIVVWHDVYGYKLVDCWLCNLVVYRNITLKNMIYLKPKC